MTVDVTRRGFLGGMLGVAVIAAMPSIITPEPAAIPSLPLIPDVTAPDGITYQWIRSHLFGEPDTANIEFRLSKGWTFVVPDAHPYLKTYALEEVVETGGLVLMQKPTAEVEKARQAEIDAGNALLDDPWRNPESMGRLLKK